MDQGCQLRTWLTHPRSVVVTEAMTAGRLRADPIRVFATPEMIRLVEQTAAEALAPFLAAGQQTVGTRVEIAHLAATPEGITVTATVELVSIDRRRLTFRVRRARRGGEGRRGHA